MRSFRRRVCVVLAWLFATVAAHGQEPIRFARLPDISPDGRLIAFSYLGDIWVVEANGGVARPVTTHEAHDTAPVFSPDGQHIAFSSNRHGSYDVFVVPVQGGKPRRLTFDSAADMVNGWSPDGKNILFTSQRSTSFPPVSELYTVPVQGGRDQRVSAFEGRDGVYSPKGDLIAYVRGAGTWYRKGYRGSANDDIWVCNADGTQNRRMTTFNGQDGSPMWSADGKNIYYVSEQFGNANICRMSLDGGSPQQVTHHVDDSVRRARMNAAGKWMVYECGADIYLAPTDGNAPPRRVAIEAYADDRTNPERLVTFTQNIAEYALSPDEKFVAFILQGELFLMPASGGKAHRMTEHPGHDHDIAWSPDMKKILFVSDRNGEDNIYVLEQNDPDHPDLTKAHSFKVGQLTKSETPNSNVSFSPDGKLIGFQRDGKLWTMSPDGSNQKVLVNQVHVFHYEWSPDSKWIVFARLDGQFASELYMVPTAGGEVRNITRYATRNFGMSWSRDGRRLAFISQRRQDLDVFVMMMQKPTREGEPPRGNDIDFDDIHLRVGRVTSFSSDESEAAISPDGNQVVFRSNGLNSDDLWLASINGSEIRRLTGNNIHPSQIRWSKGNIITFLDGNGSLRYIRAGPATPQVFGAAAVAFPSTADGQPGRVAFTAKMKINRNEMFAQMFDESWRKLRNNFYDAKHHGANWAEVRAKYQPLVKHVSMHEDFYDLIHLMLGELNASHLGIGGFTRPMEEQTADLGLLWDEAYQGPGLKIREVLKHGPADRRGIDLKAGEYVMALDGIDLTDQVNLSEQLNDKVGETVVLQIAADPKDAKRRKVELQATNRQIIVQLMYQRWAADNTRRVQELSGGKLGYIHLRAMDGPSLDDFVRTLYSDNADKDAIVLDVRYNGGGYTHDQVLSYLGGKEHTFFVTREGAKGAVLRANDRKWTKPLILMVNNRSYSDAEIFPNAFRSLGLGKLVGLPTGGYVIGTVDERLVDGSTFRVPRLGVFTTAGVNMDKTGVVPDVVVDLHPDEVARGVDAQLNKAVEVLTGDVATWKKAHPSGVTGQPDKKPEAAETPGEKKSP